MIQGSGQATRTKNKRCTLIPTFILMSIVLTSLSACKLLIFNDEKLPVTDSAAKKNAVPVALSQSLVVNDNATLAITLTATNKSSNALDYVVVTSPTHGTLSGTAPDLIYTPDSPYDGADSFTFTAADNKDISEAATISIVVTHIPDVVDPHVAALSFSPHTFGLAVPNIDDSQRSISLSGIPAGRIFSFSLNEDDAPSTNLSCSNLPADSRITGNRLHIDFGLKASAGDLTLNCSTDQGTLDINLAYTASSLSVISSSLNETPAGLSASGRTPAQSPDARYIVWQAEAAGLSHERQIALTDNTAGVTTLISSGASGEEADGVCSHPQVSADGRYVIFRSEATNLISGVSGRQIFLKDRQSNTFSLISSTDGTAANQGDNESAYPQITTDGHFAFFVSYASNFGTGAYTAQIYRKDLQTGALIIVSSLDGTPATAGNYSSTSVQITADGHFAAFTSDADNLVAGADGSQLYRKDLVTNAIVLVSSSDASTANRGNNYSDTQQITADGQYVIFHSRASNLVAGASGHQIYLKDLQSHTIKLISSVNGAGIVAGNSDSLGPHISSDGRYAVFYSWSNNLVAGVDGGQVYRLDLQSNTLTLVSTRDGTTANRADNDSYDPQISSDGHTVVFVADASNLISGASGYQKIYRKDLQTQAIALISSVANSAAPQGNDNYISMNLSGLSPDGRFIVFASQSSNLILGASGTQLYRKDRQNGEIILVSSLDGSAASQGNGESYSPQITSNGRYVVFQSNSTNLVSGSSGYQLYRKDLQTGAITLVSSSDGSAANKGNGASGNGQGTADGRYVVFWSDATNLIAGASLDQIYLRDLEANTISLISSTDGSVAHQGDGGSYGPRITPDGRYVAFMSGATNFVTGSSGGQVYRKDLQTGATGPIKLVSSSDGTAANRANQTAGYHVITPDGLYVVFGSSATNLITGVSGQQIYRKNLTTEEITLVSSKDGSTANQANSSVSDPQISTDGRYVVFFSTATNLVTGASGQQIYRRDFQTQTMTLPASVDGTAGTIANGGSYNPQMSADGQLIIFRSLAANLVSGMGEWNIYLKAMP